MINTTPYNWTREEENAVTNAIQLIILNVIVPPATINVETVKAAFRKMFEDQMKRTGESHA